MAPYKATNAIIVVGSQSVPNEYVLIIKQHKQDKYGETSGILSILFLGYSRWNLYSLCCHDVFKRIYTFHLMLHLANGLLRQGD